MYGFSNRVAVVIYRSWTTDAPNSIGPISTTSPPLNKQRFNFMLSATTPGLFSDDSQPREGILIASVDRSYSFDPFAWGLWVFVSTPNTCLDVSRPLKSSNLRCLHLRPNFFQALLNSRNPSFSEPAVGNKNLQGCPSYSLKNFTALAFLVYRVLTICKGWCYTCRSPRRRGDGLRNPSLFQHR